jgi:hypothetical protein
MGMTDNQFNAYNTAIYLEAVEALKKVKSKPGFEDVEIPLTKIIQIIKASFNGKIPDIDEN